MSRRRGRFGADLDGLRVQLVVDAAAALLVLLGATVLAVYEPRGVTRFRRRVAWESGQDVDTYRLHVANHEVGQALGNRAHPLCPGPVQLAE